MKNRKIFIQHPNRSLLKLSGGDVVKFLQGLVTNDVNELAKKPAIFSCLLTGNGRFLFDFFLFGIGDDVIVDILSEDLDAFTSKLKMYKLRSDVQFLELIGYEICQILGNEELSLESDNILTLFKDPRNAELGYRVYLKSKEVLLEFGLEEEKQDYYHCSRIKNKIVQGEDLVKEKAVILEYGYKEQSSVDFDKGCYLGQELITRTERLGEIRKKLIYMELDEVLSEDKIDILVKAKTKIITSVLYEGKYHYLFISKQSAEDIKALILV